MLVGVIDKLGDGDAVSDEVAAPTIGDCVGDGVTVDDGVGLELGTVGLADGDAEGLTAAHRTFTGFHLSDA